MSTSGILNVIYIEKNCIRDFKDFYRVSQNQWKSAVTSYSSGDYLTAVYLAGYSVECLLKYVILESLYIGELIAQCSFSIGQLIRTDRFFEPLSKHKLNKLLEIGNQKNVFKVPKESDFVEIMSWTSEWRYATQHNLTDKTALEFLQSVENFTVQLKNELEGKLRIKNFSLVG